MRACRLLILSCFFAVMLLGGNQANAQTFAPKVYAYCVEFGVPGLTPRPPADIARVLHEVGFDGGGYPVLTGPALAETLRAADDAGLQVYLLQTAVQVGPKATAPYDPAVLPAIRSLKGRPVTVVVTVEGLKPGDPAGMEPAVKAFREMGEAAAEAGVRISAYNHLNSWNESIPVNIELVKKVNHPNVGYNFNVCHWLKVEGNKDYRPLLRANADKLFCVTICGAQIGAEAWINGLIQPLDKGDFDNRAVLTTLKEIGYKGPVGVMCYGISGDTREYLQRSMKKWKEWTANP